MADQKTALMAHLMRRAGFGANRDELETRVAKGYEATVEELLCPDSREPNNRYEMLRYHPWAWSPGTPRGMGAAQWFYAMISTDRSLEEKIALFWHSVFAVGVSKVDHYGELTDMISTFRTKGMGNYQELLLEMARNPAMIYWLDNHENHADSVNENWGRELLELFSMGVDNYTEADVRECARAFTGWTIAHHLPRFPLTRFQWEFEYRELDHDDGEKTFLGETGRFNGEDIIDIILKQPACATFITRHLYNFFVADEPEVPKWPNEPPRDPKAIEYLSKVFVESDYEIKPVLRALFNSDFFKEATYQKVKSPVEVVVGTLKLTEHLGGPDPEWSLIIKEPNSMGQDLLDPPTVEGWHTGKEWINSGAFINRVNFVADKLKNAELPGVKIIIEKVKQSSTSDSPESIVDACLEELGDLKLETDTYNELIADINFVDGSNGNGNIDHQIANTLSMIAGTVEYQFC